MLIVVFFKQKTAYEMRISDWSSDVCSSDLRTVGGLGDVAAPAEPDAACLLQRRQNRHGEASGTGLAFVDGGDAVGDDDDSAQERDPPGRCGADVLPSDLAGRRNRKVSPRGRRLGGRCLRAGRPEQRLALVPDGKAGRATIS